MKKLFIHIGFPKTGSTSIQEFFYSNKNIIESSGIYYPAPYNGKDLSLRKCTAHLSMSESDSHSRFDHIKWSRYREMYLNNILKHPFEINVLSAESFVYDNPSNLNPFKKFFSISIICYIRNICDYCNSVEKQLIKVGLRPSLFSCSRDKKHHLLARIDEYISNFSSENCFFRNFDKIRKEGDLLSDFFNILSSPQDFSHLAKKKVNITPLDVVTMFLFHLTFLPFERADWAILRDELLRLDLMQWSSFRTSFLPTDFFYFDDECKRRIRRQGELLQDPDWYDYTMSRSEKLAAIESRDLPPEIQHDIWEKLSDKARSIILCYWPKAGRAKPHEPLLPSMEKIAPDVFEQMTVLRRRYTVYLGNFSRQQEIVDELLERDKKKRRAVLLFSAQPDTLFSRLRACLAPLVSTSARQAYDIRRSGLFDTGWYLEHYSDVAEAGIDPVVHYVRFGAKEGRDPAPWFSTSAYLQANPDVAASGVNPFYHYIRHGVAEGRGSHEAHC